jgi:competence protein ComFC
VYDYRDSKIKKAIWLLKYNGKKRLANIFAEILYGRILEELADLVKLDNFNYVILVPIPLSLKRLRERGFNQSLLICKKLIALDKENKKSKNRNFGLVEKALVKTKDIEHQTRIENRQKRMENIIGSFAIKNAEQIKNRNIILIDDVTTTGATLSEAKKILRQAGAKKIIAFTVAH